MMMLVSVGAFLACGKGSSTSVCATTCLGCCDSSGFCQPGSSLNACGLSGRACMACATNAVCSIGSCLTPDLPGSTGGGAVGDGGPGGGSPSVNTCVGRYRECRGACVDPLTDETNCGACGVQCAAGLVCNAGLCKGLPQNCVVERCPDDFGCNPETRACARTCFSNADCRTAGSVCNQGGCDCADPSTSLSCGVCGRNFSSQTCRCAQGFQSSQLGCADIDECVETPGICGARAARCINLLGSYTCECQPNSANVGGRCVPNLCSTNNGGCDRLATCTMVSETQVACQCPRFSIGDGRSCKFPCDSFDPCPSGLACFPDPTSPTLSSCDQPGFGLEADFCTTNRDCSSGTFCTQQTFGITKTCARLCEGASDCGPTQNCFPTAEGVSQCLMVNGSSGCSLLAQNCETACYIAAVDGGPTTFCAPRGRASEGATCGSAVDCTPGSICFRQDAGPMDFRCTRVCDPNAPSCPGGQCVPFGILEAGVCR
jgi:hypothetical protein